MTLDELATLRVAIWGMGTEGLAAAQLLVGRGVRPLLVDDRVGAAVDAVEAELAGAWQVQRPDDVVWSELDVVVRSPGVSRYRAELAVAEAAGVTVTTALAVWLEDFAHAPVLAVTGTKGKSTTAALAAALLGAAGKRVALVGNIGVPVTSQYGAPRADAYVVEVSSFQAADVTAAPAVVVLTSLAPDHLDWHGDLEHYYGDKLRLVEAGHPGHPGQLAVSAASEDALARTAGHPRRTLFGPEGRVRADAAGLVEVDGRPLGDARALRLPGKHNLWNLCGAVAGVLLLEGEPPSPEAFDATVSTFVPLPSRCRTVGTRDGLTYVDDALASNPFATAASLRAFAGRELTVIVGGADRGVDPAPLVEAVRQLRPRPRVVVLAPGPPPLLEALGRPGPDGAQIGPTEVGDLAAAVQLAREITPDGGVVLFSPAAPTPAGGGGYGARAAEFLVATGLEDHDGVPAEPSGTGGRRTP